MLNATKAGKRPPPNLSPKSPPRLTCTRPPVSRPLRRSFATVHDPPVRRYGGLKDQDRIFTNAYCRHDHGLKGAQVRAPLRPTPRNSILVSLSSVTGRLASYKRHPPQRRLLDHPDHQGLWSSWSWWCRFPLGSQMEFHEQTWLGKRSSVCPNDQIAVAGSQNIRTDLATWS